MNILRPCSEHHLHSCKIFVKDNFLHDYSNCVYLVLGSGVKQVSYCPDAAEKPAGLPRMLYSSQGLGDLEA